jgi:hypothetical protein
MEQEHSLPLQIERLGISHVTYVEALNRDSGNNIDATNLLLSDPLTSYHLSITTSLKNVFHARFPQVYCCLPKESTRSYGDRRDCRQ